MRQKKNNAILLQKLNVKIKLIHSIWTILGNLKSPFPIPSTPVGIDPLLWTEYKSGPCPNKNYWHVQWDNLIWFNVTQDDFHCTAKLNKAFLLKWGQNFIPLENGNNYLLVSVGLWR